MERKHNIHNLEIVCTLHNKDEKSVNIKYCAFVG
jgi:hypothetical protein